MDRLHCFGARTAATLLVALALALPPAARAAAREGSLLMAITTVSYHTRAADELNPVNPGLGLGYAVTDDVDILAGAFKNSYAAESRYVMARGRLTEPGAPVAFHLCGGYLDGYRDETGKRTTPFAFGVDLQYGPLVLLMSPAPMQRGFSLSLWLVFEGGRSLFGR